MIPVIAGVGMAAGAAAGVVGDMMQTDAARDAQQQTAEQIEAANRDAQLAAGSAMSRLDATAPMVAGQLESGYLGGVDFATQGFGQQREDLLQSGALGADAIAQGQGGALSALYSGVGNAGDILVNRQDRAGQMLDQQGGMYGNYQADPGYAFRRQEGEDAMRRMQSAQGGRFGGAAMKALVDYNQNMASQEFGNYVGRANSEFGARSGSDAQALQAGGQLANIYAGAGQTGAGIIGQNAGQLADIYGRTGTQLANQAAGAGGTLGQMTQGYHGSLGDLAWNRATQDNQYQMGAAGVSAGMIPAQAANNASTVQYAGGVMGGIGNAASQVGQLGVLSGLYGDSGAYGGQPANPYGSSFTYDPAADPNTDAFIGPR
jgi:hypothetical protein